MFELTLRCVDLCSTCYFPACDYLGERMASLFGITSAKYQYAIDEYYRMKKEVQHAAEGWCDSLCSDRGGNGHFYVPALARGGEGRNPLVRRSRTNDRPSAISGGRRWASHQSRATGGDRRSPWCDLSDRERKSGSPVIAQATEPPVKKKTQKQPLHFNVW